MKTLLLFIVGLIPFLSLAQGGIVTLGYYSVRQGGNSGATAFISINFATTSETNVHRFIIEKKIVGQNYSEFKSINGSGNSNSTLIYGVSPDYDIDTTGICYVYRITAIYFDSSFQILDSSQVCWSRHNICLISSDMLNDEEINATVLGATLTDDRWGQPDQSYSFDGIDDFISTFGLDFDYDQNFAIMFWVKIPPTQSNTDTTENVIMSRWSEDTSLNNGYSFHISINNQTSVYPGTLNVSRFGKACNQNPSLTSVSQINDNQFHLVFFQKTGSSMELYIDHNLESTTQDLINCNQMNYTPTFFGKKHGGTPAFFNGILDDIKFFGCELDSSDIIYFTPVQETESDKLLVYPNPVLDRLYIVSAKTFQISEMFVYNLLGEKIGIFDFNEFIDLSFLQRGTYFAKFRNHNNQTVGVRKIIKG